MKLLCLITSYGRNADYCEIALSSLIESITAAGIAMSTAILIVDFSGPESVLIDEVVKKVGGSVQVTRLVVPGNGFCKNLNVGFSIVPLVGAEYFAYFNDDVRLPSNWVGQALTSFEENPTWSLQAGVQQETDEVMITAQHLREAEMPLPKKGYEKMSDLQGKWGDYSAWMVRSLIIFKVGALDEYFDPAGIIADNDWLWRLRRKGFVPVRNFQLPYLHAKGVTQRLLRPDWPYDDIGLKARSYFRKKWGVDPYSGASAAPFKTPFEE